MNKIIVYNSQCVEKKVSIEALLKKDDDKSRRYR